VRAEGREWVRRGRMERGAMGFSTGEGRRVKGVTVGMRG
jgi:hypothetical protein